MSQIKLSREPFFGLYQHHPRFISNGDIYLDCVWSCNSLIKLNVQYFTRVLSPQVGPGAKSHNLRDNIIGLCQSRINIAPSNGDGGNLYVGEIVMTGTINGLIFLQNKDSR